MDKVYCLSESTEAPLLCPLLREALESLNINDDTARPLGHLEYISILAYVSFLETWIGWPCESLRAQLSKTAGQNHVKILYEGEESARWTLFVTTLGSLIQVLVKDQSGLMYSINFNPSEFVDLRKGPQNPRFLCMAEFTRLLKNEVIYPIAHAHHINTDTYPGAQSLETLPNELISLIASRILVPRHLLNLEMTSKRIRGILFSQQELWRDLYKRDFPIQFGYVKKDLKNMDWRYKYRLELNNKPSRRRRISSIDYITIY